MFQVLSKKVKCIGICFTKQFCENIPSSCKFMCVEILLKISQNMPQNINEKKQFCSLSIGFLLRIVVFTVPKFIKVSIIHLILFFVSLDIYQQSQLSKAGVSNMWPPLKIFLAHKIRRRFYKIYFIYDASLYLKNNCPNYERKLCWIF